MNIKSDFGNAISALIELLEAVGEKYWVVPLRNHLAIWKQSGDASSHRSIYGGMGSFNDVMICRQNNYHVTEEQEPFVGQLFNDLSSVCYALSQQQGFTADALRLELGTVGCPMQGWRCRECGYGEVSRRNIDYYLAYRVVREAMIETASQGLLADCVRQTLSLNFPEITEARQKLEGRLTASGIAVNDRNGWIRLCPKCQSENISVYRWVELWDGIFRPDVDNLSVKTRS